MYAVAFKDLKEAMTNICEAEDLRDAMGMEEIQDFLKIACKTGDPFHLLRAYTAETDFYRCLNRLHAKIPFRKYTDDDRQKWFVQFVATPRSKEQNSKFGWKGVCYHGMLITKDDLARYKVDQWVVNKAFQSTTKNRDVTKQFIQNPAKNQLAAICKYTVLRDYDAFDISSISEFPEEEEVLLFPNTPFQLKSITMTDPIEIEFS